MPKILVSMRHRLLTDVMKYESIILDIEGTTTPISFVKKQLFPYVRKNLDDFLTKNWNSLDQVISQLVELQKKETEECPEISVPPDVASVSQYINFLMDLDRKVGPLKELQGKMWTEAFESGQVKGKFYAEVPKILRDWTSEGIKVYVYSSGSIHAQKLIYKFSEKGDLSGLISGNFDTTIGSKVEAQSYERILTEIKATKPSHVLFVSDNVKGLCVANTELGAATEAGLDVFLCYRKGNDPIDIKKTPRGDFDQCYWDGHVFDVIRSFERIDTDVQEEDNEEEAEKDVNSEEDGIHELNQGHYKADDDAGEAPPKKQKLHNDEE